MKNYLLDTNICIYYIKGQFNLKKKFAEVGYAHCAISEITYAELLYGVEKSLHKDKNKKALNDFMIDMKIISIFDSLEIFAKEKVRLKNSGALIPDFDLLIGATAIANNLELVTNNSNHFRRMKSLKIVDWTKS